MKLARPLLAVVRTSWLVVGNCLLIVAGLECTYRVKYPVPIEESAIATGTFPDSVEWRAIVDTERQTYRTRWQPLVYYRREPFQGSGFTVDSLGFRLTVEGEADRSAPLIVFFGGSTMWGTYQRDPFTIPSQVVARLASHGQAVRALNLGEFGYESSREVVLLLQLLLDGVRPDVVVFYDGINDVFAALQNGSPGVPLNDNLRARDYEFTRVAFDWRRDIRSDAAAVLVLAQQMLNRSLLLTRVRSAVSPARPDFAPDVDPELLASRLADRYLQTVVSVCALGTTYGFFPLMYWQPTIHTTGKPLTTHEKALLDGIMATPQLARVRELHARTLEQLQRRREPQAHDAFQLLADLYDGVSQTVFVDRVGHMHEEPVGAVADRLAADIASVLLQQANPCNPPPESRSEGGHHH